MDIEISVVPNDWGEDKEAEDEKQQQQTEDTENRDQSFITVDNVDNNCNAMECNYSTIVHTQMQESCKFWKFCSTTRLDKDLIWPLLVLPMASSFRSSIYVANSADFHNRTKIFYS